MSAIGNKGVGTKVVIIAAAIVVDVKGSTVVGLIEDTTGVVDPEDPAGVSISEICSSPKRQSGGGGSKE